MTAVRDTIYEVLAFAWVGGAVVAYAAQFRDLAGPIAAMLGL